MKKQKIIWVFVKIALLVLTGVLIWNKGKETLNGWVTASPSGEKAPVAKPLQITEITVPSDGGWSQRHYKPHDCALWLDPESTPAVDIDVRVNGSEDRTYRFHAIPKLNTFASNDMGDHVSWLEVRIASGVKKPPGVVKIRVSER
ncbi:MAG: hypothetical protein NTV72_03900 [Candidatus Taylorbacteria bacterium]|nr:hypothetical protein [Candidatus Taylorbacteria bacterium]